MTIVHSKQQKIKARLVSIGDREDGFQRFVTPGPKRVFEFNAWVLREKVSLGLALAAVLIVGAVLASLGWQAILIGAAFLFLVGFFRGGDIETGP